MGGAGDGLSGNVKPRTNATKEDPLNEKMTLVGSGQWGPTESISPSV